MQVQSLGWEDPLEEGMATHSSFLAWKIPWTEEPGGYSPWGHKESAITENACTHTITKCICSCKEPLIYDCSYILWSPVK